MTKRDDMSVALALSAESPPPAQWLAMFIPGGHDDDVRWFHFYAPGQKRCACANYERPFMAYVANASTSRLKVCPRCVEAFTFAGKPAPEFP